MAITYCMLAKVYIYIKINFISLKWFLFLMSFISRLIEDNWIFSYILYSVCYNVSSLWRPLRKYDLLQVCLEKKIFSEHFKCVLKIAQPSCILLILLIWTKVVRLQWQNFENLIFFLLSSSHKQMLADKES